MGCTKHEFSPGDTLPAAKVNEIQDAVIALEDGTTPAGDSAKLGGKDASEYALDTDLANYLPLSGGTVANPTTKPMKLKNTADGADTVYLEFVGSEVLGRFGFNGIGNPVVHSPALGTTTILHTGNKPSGTYTGNGSATERTINIGGIGKTLRIFSSAYGMSFIGKYGGVGLGTDGITIITSGECKFENGVLTMSSTSKFFNANAYVYEYDLY